MAKYYAPGYFIDDGLSTSGRMQTTFNFFRTYGRKLSFQQAAEYHQLNPAQKIEKAQGYISRSRLKFWRGGFKFDYRKQWQEFEKDLASTDLTLSKLMPGGTLRQALFDKGTGPMRFSLLILPMLMSEKILRVCKKFCEHQNCAAL